MRRHIDFEARGAGDAQDAMEVQAIINSQVSWILLNCA
jgi:hypothetical protein